MGKDFLVIGCYGFGVDGVDDVLVVKVVGGFGDYIGIGDGGGVEIDFVGVSQQQCLYIVMVVYFVVYGQWYEVCFGGVGDQIKYGVVVFMCGMDVQKVDFICVCCVIGVCCLNWIFGIVKVYEIYVFDDVVIGYVKVGDYLCFQYFVFFRLVCVVFCLD